MVDDDVERMRAYTASGEHLLWVGRPDTSAHFSRHDMVLVPFSLVWCGFFVSIVPLGSDGVPWLFALPFLAIAAWLLLGRFVYKTWRQARTLYALTDQRALIKDGRPCPSRLPAPPCARAGRTHGRPSSRIRLVWEPYTVPVGHWRVREHRHGRVPP